MLGVAAGMAGILMAISPVLQIRRMLSTGSSRDFSLLYPTLLCVGFILWLAYGWALGNPPMIVSNAFSLTFMLITIGVAIALRRGPGKAGRAGEVATEPVPPPG
jgi:uncharacterized protein with PQ loop repeat